MDTKHGINDPFLTYREKMVAEQLESRGIKHDQVLSVFRKVPRHLFVNEEDYDHAYDDSPLPIGYNQTISQPYIVAYMTSRVSLSKTDTVLEIGTGSGYQTAILAELAGKVATIEIVPQLSKSAKKNFNTLGYKNIHAKQGDGYNGWPEHAPFNAVILTAAPANTIPGPLLDQLKDGGKLIAPVGRDYQELILITRDGDEFESKRLLSVRFVPMVGIIQDITE